MRVRTGDFCVGGHPVMVVRHSLFSGQEWQDGGERVHRERLAIGECDVFTGDRETVAHSVTTDHRVGIANDLDPQVPKIEFVIHRVSRMYWQRRNRCAYCSSDWDRWSTRNVSLPSSSRRSTSARVRQTRIALCEPVRLSRVQMRSVLVAAAIGTSLCSTGGGSILSSSVGAAATGVELDSL